MEKIQFKDLPDMTTPLSSANLNQMQDNMENAIIPIKLVNIGVTTPATATTGDMFYNTTDNKIYTATADNTWDNGSTPRYDGFYINTSDNTLFYYNGTTLVGAGGSQTSINVKNEETNSETDVYSCNYINNLVETITNANGTALKYADGTMICYGYPTVTFGGGTDYYGLFNTSNTMTINFPTNFISSNDLIVTVTSDNFNFFSIIVSTKSTNSFAVRGFYPPKSNPSNIDLNYIAIGKWKN